MPETQSRDTASTAILQSVPARFETVANQGSETRQRSRSPQSDNALSAIRCFVPVFVLPAVVLCGFGFCGVVAKDASPSAAPVAPVAPAIHQVDAATRRVEIHDTDTVLLEYPDWLTTVKSLDPAVIHVSAVRPNCLRIQRVSEGKAKLQAIDRGDRRYSIEVIVRAQVEGQK